MEWVIQLNLERKKSDKKSSKKSIDKEYIPNNC